MSELVVIREMQEKDILALDTQFVQQGLPSRQEILMNYLEEQLVKQRTVFVAEKKATLLGYVTLLPLAKEGPFKNLYPEIADFNVFLPFQKQGVGRLLLNRAENVAKSYADTVSLGVYCILVMVQRKDYISNKDMCQMVQEFGFKISS